MADDGVPQLELVERPLALMYAIATDIPKTCRPF
jgi:hypothetical protein